jgi:hypothetical protein
MRALWIGNEFPPEQAASRKCVSHCPPKHAWSIVRDMEVYAKRQSKEEQWVEIP